MNAQQLIATARRLVANDKGLLAMDESNPTCNERFAKWRAVIVMCEDANVMAAQKALYHRAKCNRAARRGEYNATMERT